MITDLCKADQIKYTSTDLKTRMSDYEALWDMLFGLYENIVLPLNRENMHASNDKIIIRPLDHFTRIFINIV